jgi:hypothetical protein
MSIEDINYLKANSIKQNYTFLVDSKDRNRNIYPDPNNYIVEFSTPFRNIIGMEIVDASIPRTMYNVDYENNIIYYYIGKDINDSLIKNGVSDYNTSYLELTNTHPISNNVINDNSLSLIYGTYGTLSNSINIYNIYNNELSIGGNRIGITISFTIKANIEYFNYINNEYIIFYFGYDHLINTSTFGRVPIYVRAIKQPPPSQSNEKSIFNLIFTIGDEVNQKIILNIDLTNYTHVSWTISSDNVWNIYINSLLVGTYNSIKSIANVFYTDKFIGKGNVPNNNEDLEISYNYNIYLRDFKLYNNELSAADVLACMNNNSFISNDNNADNRNYDIDSENVIKNLVVWYRMNKLKSANIIENDGSRKLIEYVDMFKKLIITPGDYTLKTFFTYYSDINDFEIGFKEHSEPSELTNLIDIYAKLPFILDMKRSTITENIGFDLYASSNTQGRYTYINSYNGNPNMIKMFHSILNVKQNKEFNNGIVDIHIITSPGIVYFIGNKYIIMKCPEIEEHLFGSLSYSKYSLGLAKFRVDNVGINNEHLSFTKLPVREFHPIGKLSRVSLRFETNKGTLYDFKGVNHNIIFAIYYYEPKQQNFPTGSILNPEYKMNYIDYQYNQQEIEGDSDDEQEDFSRDNIEEYKKKEQEYSEYGIQLQKYKRNFINNKYVDSEDEEHDVYDNEDYEKYEEDEDDEDDEEDEDDEDDEEDEEDEEGATG